MRSILFDFGGTLDYPQHWLDRFLTHYRAAGINLTREQLDPGFDYATRIAYRSTPMLAAYGLIELVDYLVHLQIGFMGRHGPEELRENLAAAAGGRRLDEVAGWITQAFVAQSREGFALSREALAALSGRFRMGVVSNFYGNLENILAEADLTRFFGAVADSSRVGIFKPAPGIFIAALKQLDALPAETAMVGDSLSKDCVPARKLGITAVWLRHPGVSSANAGAPGEAADFTIEALAELEHLRWHWA
jgi:HAD superfamily hydrolase (TIGR01549 family)